jgi:hypothetical protein
MKALHRLVALPNISPQFCSAPWHHPDHCQPWTASPPLQYKTSRRTPSKLRPLRHRHRQCLILALLQLHHCLPQCLAQGLRSCLRHLHRCQGPMLLVALHHRRRCQHRLKLHRSLGRYWERSRWAKGSRRQLRRTGAPRVQLAGCWTELREEKNVYVEHSREEV